MTVLTIALSAALLGYPYLAFGNVGIAGFIAGRSQEMPLLLVGEWALAPAMTTKNSSAFQSFRIETFSCPPQYE